MEERRRVADKSATLSIGGEEKSCSVRRKKIATDSLEERKVVLEQMELEEKKVAR